MFCKHHKHNPHAPLGLLLGRLALTVVGAIIKNKLADRREKQERREEDKRRNADRSLRQA